MFILIQINFHEQFLQQMDTYEKFKYKTCSTLVVLIIGVKTDQFLILT